jgi:hypothetical protein
MSWGASEDVAEVVAHAVIDSNPVANKKKWQVLLRLLYDFMKFPIGCSI